jgi:hypothetical protein
MNINDLNQTFEESMKHLMVDNVLSPTLIHYDDMKRGCLYKDNRGYIMYKSFRQSIFTFKGGIGIAISLSSIDCFVTVATIEEATLELKLVKKTEHSTNVL